MAKRLCLTDGCGEELPEHGKLEFCPACRTAFARNKVKPLAAFELWKYRVTRMHNRFAYISRGGNSGKAKQSSITARGVNTHGKTH